jgi:hypothetical protein
MQKTKRPFAIVLGMLAAVSFMNPAGAANQGAIGGGGKNCVTVETCVTTSICTPNPFGGDMCLGITWCTSNIVCAPAS